MQKKFREGKSKFWISMIFFASRMILLFSLPLNGVKSYGDFWNFYHLASLGQPFRDIWVEFPPLFPYLSRGIYLLVGGKEHAYIYLSVILFSFIQGCSLYVFQLLAEEIWSSEGGFERTLIYAMLVLGLFYGWTYFDPLAVFLMLLGLLSAIKSRASVAGGVLGLGALVKWFPILVIPSIWKWLDPRKALRLTITAVAVVAVIWGALFLIHPNLTRASLISQGAKGSWESVWAILDGNLHTGNFNPAADRNDPMTASLQAGNPALISPWLTLVVFAGIGLFLFWKAEVQSVEQLIAFSGVTLVLFFIWSPGYSPQWVLYLLPLVLLSFERSRSLLVSLVLLLTNLLEWPILLSRGYFQYLPGLIVLRTVLYLMVALLFIEPLFAGGAPQRESHQ